MSIQGSVNQLIGFGALAAGGIHKDIEANAESAIRESIGAINKGAQIQQDFLDTNPSYAAENPSIQSGINEEKSVATQLERRIPTTLAKHGAIGLKRLQRKAEDTTELIESSNSIIEMAIQRAQQEINSRQGVADSMESRIQQTKQMFNNIGEGVKDEQTNRT